MLVKLPDFEPVTLNNWNVSVVVRLASEVMLVTVRIPP
jgi:hypothetical protein